MSKLFSKLKRFFCAKAIAVVDKASDRYFTRKEEIDGIMKEKRWVIFKGEDDPTSIPVEWICRLNGQRKKAPTPQEMIQMEARRERVKQNVLLLKKEEGERKASGAHLRQNKNIASYGITRNQRLFTYRESTFFSIRGLFAEYQALIMGMRIKAVIAKSFERIHCSNLVGMGVIPLCFKPGEDAESLGLTGHERCTIDLPSSVSDMRPGQDITVVTDTGKSFICTSRFDTEVELAYFDHGCILPFVIRNLINSRK